MCRHVSKCMHNKMMYVHAYESVNVKLCPCVSSNCLINSPDIIVTSSGQLIASQRTDCLSVTWITMGRPG